MNYSTTLGIVPEHLPLAQRRAAKFLLIWAIVNSALSPLALLLSLAGILALTSISPIPGWDNWLFFQLFAWSCVSLALVPLWALLCFRCRRSILRGQSLACLLAQDLCYVALLLPLLLAAALATATYRAETQHWFGETPVYLAAQLIPLTLAALILWTLHILRTARHPLPGPEGRQKSSSARKGRENI